MEGKNINLTVLYAFDNEGQLPQFRLSLISLLKSNNSDYKVLVITSNHELEKEVQKIFREFNLEFNFSTYVLSYLNNISRSGMFYWLIAPFLIDTKYMLQLDNDIIVNSSLKLLLKRVKFKRKFSIFGVKIKLSEDN